MKSEREGGRERDFSGVDTRLFLSYVKYLILRFLKKINLIFIESFLQIGIN